MAYLQHSFSSADDVALNLRKSDGLRRRAHQLIPGGAHTYAKGDDQYPERAPAFIARGHGSHVWDVDGNEFIEYGMGLRAVTLGHAYKPVVEAAYRQMQLGANFTRPARIEVEAAESILDIIDGAEMVKFAKNGSDVTTAAVRLARAYTDRDLIAICGDQPFFSTDDWFIGTTNMNAGIPQLTRDMTVRFHYNDAASLQELFDKHPGRIAGVILEAEASDPPTPGFLNKIKTLCRAERLSSYFRRDDHRLSLGSRRRTEVSRRGAPPIHVWKSSWQWVCRFGAGGRKGYHAARRLGA